MKTALTTLGGWTVEFGDESRTSGQKEDVLPCLARLFTENGSGRIVISEDVGGRSWLPRLLGLAPRISQMHLAIEWSSDVASLIFFDDAASEYRAKDPERPIQTDEDTRRAIAHGELKPHPLDECLGLVRAREAIQEFMRTGDRPNWLQYEYVH